MDHSENLKERVLGVVYPVALSKPLNNTSAAASLRGTMAW